MSLWDLFWPVTFLLEHFFYTLWLLQVSTVPYAYLLYALYRYPTQRTPLVLFFLLSLFASAIMYYTIGPRIDNVIAPLGLLSVMAFPLGMLLRHRMLKKYADIHIWVIATLAGWMHSWGWYAWLYALAKS